MTKNSVFRIGLILCALTGAVAASLLPGGASSGAVNAEIVRPTLPPLPTQSRPRTPDATAVPGSHILLSADSVQRAVGLRTVVQWQGGDGLWNDVDGWRSEVTGRVAVMWWVSPNDFGKGPFRWVAYVEDSRKPVLVSAPFSLPWKLFERAEVTLVPLPQ